MGTGPELEAARGSPPLSLFVPPPGRESNWDFAAAAVGQRSRATDRANADAAEEPAEHDSVGEP